MKTCSESLHGPDFDPEQCFILPSLGINVEPSRLTSLEMLKKLGAVFLVFVCAQAVAQSVASADHWIAIRAGRLFIGTEKFAANHMIPGRHRTRARKVCYEWRKSIQERTDWWQK